MLGFSGSVLLLAQESATQQSLALSRDWWIVVGVAGAALLAMLAFSYLTRAGIIARATTKEAVRQPVFGLLLAIGLVLLVLNTYLPFFSLGEDVKMLKDCGLATILISSLLLAVWTSSTSIADEIEGKTAMTLLSKPITRRQFVVGKYLGIMESVLVLLAVGGACLLLLVYFKYGYDAKEAGKEVPGWFVLERIGDSTRGYPWFEPQRLAEMVQVIPGLVLIFFEVAVLSAISVAISTRLPMVVNMTACFAIFVVGHLTPVLVLAEGTGGGVEVVRFVGQLVATVLPGLEHFKMEGAVATERLVPPIYLGFSALYCAAFSAAAILLAFILFEDRDLA